jgi:prepilin-type N-terminal cleavage/methylation domain-containing protein
MWRSSATEAPRARRGFTLLEAMVSLLLLVIVLTVAMAMLFQMRAFAERQQFYMLPRQAARRAADYLSYYVASASDLNEVASPTNPNALVMYYDLNSATVQASYDNLTGAEPNNAVTTPNVTTSFGDVGTDVITLVAPLNPAKYTVWAPFLGFGTNKDIYLNFRGGCGGPGGTDDATNLAQFKAATGFDGTSSALLMFEDRNGNWSYFQIPAAAYAAAVSNCADVTTYKNIHLVADTASATLPAPPGGVAGFQNPVSLVTGIQFISFRVRTDPADNIPKLQQKLGLFDPNTDNPGTAFVNVMENIEDLQIAYQFATGAIWNNTTGTRVSKTFPFCNVDPCNNGVPVQGGPNAVQLEQLDVTAVIGLRFSLTARSPKLSLGSQQLSQVSTQGIDAAHRSLNLHFRPASENHPVTPDPVVAGSPQLDLFDHYRATATLMLRNRMLGY